MFFHFYYRERLHCRSRRLRWACGLGLAAIGGSALFLPLFY